MKTIKALLLIVTVLFFMVELFLVIMILLGPENEARFYGYNHVQTVPFNQPIVNNQVQVGIGKKIPFDADKLAIDGYIVAYNDINTEYAWVHLVVAIDDENEMVTVSVNDKLGLYTIDFADIEGIYLGDANLFEQILFISTNPWLFFLNIGLAISLIILLTLWQVEHKVILLSDETHGKDM